MIEVVAGLSDDIDIDDTDDTVDCIVDYANDNLTSNDVAQSDFVQVSIETEKFIPVVKATKRETNETRRQTTPSPAPRPEPVLQPEPEPTDADVVTDNDVDALTQVTIPELPPTADKSVADEGAADEIIKATDVAKVVEVEETESIIIPPIAPPPAPTKPLKGRARKKADNKDQNQLSFNDYVPFGAIDIDDVLSDS
jgi:hypothetical protein